MEDGKAFSIINIEKLCLPKVGMEGSPRLHSSSAPHHLTCHPSFNSQLYTGLSELCLQLEPLSQASDLTSYCLASWVSHRCLELSQNQAKPSLLFISSTLPRPFPPSLPPRIALLSFTS